MTFYIFHRHKVCLVDCVALICGLYSWWEGFEFSSLATLPLGFNCGSISTSACGSSTGVCSWGCPGGLGFAPVRTRCGGGAAAWVAGFLAAPGTQGSLQLGQQEIQCSRRVWQPVLANMLQYSCLEKPLPGREAWQAIVHGSQIVGHYWSDAVCKDASLFCLWQLCPSESWARRWCSCLACRDPGGAKCAGTRTAPATGVMALSGSFFQPFVAGNQKASLASFSIVLPIQALRGLDCLGAFSLFSESGT